MTNLKTVFSAVEQHSSARNTLKENHLIKRSVRRCQSQRTLQNPLYTRYDRIIGLRTTFILFSFLLSMLALQSSPLLSTIFECIITFSSFRIVLFKRFTFVDSGQASTVNVDIFGVLLCKIWYRQALPEIKHDLPTSSYAAYTVEFLHRKLGSLKHPSTDFLIL